MVSYLRPRKFGKSLWLSILEYYYDVNYKGKFDTLFGKYHLALSRNSYRLEKTQQEVSQRTNFKLLSAG